MTLPAPSGPFGRLVVVTASGHSDVKVPSARGAIHDEDLAPWQDTTRIIRGADLHTEIAALKARPGRPRFIQLSRLLPRRVTSPELVSRMVRTGELEISGQDQAEVDTYFDQENFRFHGDGFHGVRGGAGAAAAGR